MATALTQAEAMNMGTGAAPMPLGSPTSSPTRPMPISSMPYGLGGAGSIGGSMQSQAIDAATEEQRRLEEERRKAMEASLQQAQQQGYRVGSYTPTRMNASWEVPEESDYERYLARQQSFLYGRDPYAAQAAVDRARTMAGGYAAPLTQTAAQTAGLGANYARMGLDPALAQAAYGSLMQAAQAPEGPSAAQAQLQLGTNQAMANQLALARSGRGAGESVSALRQAQEQNAGISQNMAQQSAMLRAQEDQAFRQRQLAAYQAAGAIGGDIRAQDIGAGQGYMGLALQGYQGAGQVGMTGEQLANEIRRSELTGGMGYEENLAQLLGQRLGKPAGDSGMTTADWAKLGLTAGGAAAGFFAGGPAGAVAGGTAGYQVGNSIK